MKYLFALLFAIAFSFSLPAMANSADPREKECVAAHGPKSSSMEYILQQGAEADIKVLTLTGLDLELLNQAYTAKYRNEPGTPDNMTTLLIADPAGTQFPFVAAVAIADDNCSLFVFRFEKAKIVELLDAVAEAKKGI